MEILMKARRYLSAILAALLFLTGPAWAQKTEPQVTLFTNVNVFDGVNDKLIRNANVLVEGEFIKTVSTDSIKAAGATVIDGGGRTLMPGLIYMHEHLMLQASGPELLFDDDRYLAILATRTAGHYLDRGITSVRDAAGNTFGLKNAIDAGVVPGPRIYPSGSMISQSSGHADHLFPTQPTAFMSDGRPDRLVRSGDMAVVDGVPEVLKGAREQLRRGASQIKIAVGGGTGSIADPLEVVEFTPEEIRAATQAAGDFKTYVLAHVYNNEGIRRAIDNGVKSIEHANLIDRATLQYMKDKDVWLSPQVSVYTYIPAGYSKGQAEKHRQAFAGIDQMFKTAKEIGFENIVFGSDIISSPKEIETILGEFTKRSKWFSNVEILRQATSNGGKLLALSGAKNPYPGKLGVIETGAHADLLLLDGNPLEDLNVIVNFEKNMKLIMKAGKVHKSALN
jgi:imidazolonepropionase-like amidohydrolase